MFRTSQKKRQSGFTLIELMIVIAIIGILAAILTPILMRARFKTYHTACVQNERNLTTALELYSLEYKLYPDDLEILTSTTSPYITKIEDCPSSSISYSTTYTVDSDNKGYVIECPGVHNLQLVGVVSDTYPQAVNGKVNQYGEGG